MTVTIDRAPVPTVAFATITLSELDRHAARQTRVDRKYLLRLDDLGAALDGMPAGTTVLQIDGHRSFTYASTYFDTPDLRCYHDAARRRRRRYKARTRHYTDSGRCRFEVKTHDGRCRTVKSGIPYDAADASLLTPAAGRLITTATRAAANPATLSPVLHTRYRRTTLALSHEPVRITIDTDLQWRTPDRDHARLGAWVIIETKGGPAPSTADYLLWRLGHRPTKISKYGTGLALLHPELPSNKWHPALTKIQPAVGSNTTSG